MPARDTEFILGFDTETTGLDPASEHILTAGLVLMQGAEVVSKELFRINPGVPIPYESSQIHGITDADVADWDPADVVIPRLIATIKGAWDDDVPVGGHNLPFDFNFLAHEAKRLGLEPFKVTGPCLDSMVIQRRLGAYKATLTATAASFGYQQQEPHGAVEDAELSARCLRRQLEGPTGDYEMRDLFVLQRQYHREWNFKKAAQFKAADRSFDGSEWPMAVID